MNDLHTKSIYFTAFVVAAALGFASPAFGMDRVTLRRDGKTLEAAGKVLVKAQDGGLVVLGRDGVLWLIPPEEIIDRVHDDEPFAPLPRDEIAKRILAELPQGFKVNSTAHYMIFYDTSPAYAQWCGSLFERLYMAFTNLWSRKGFELSEPEFPLVAIVFADKRAYQKFSEPDLGDANEAVIGYYGILSNRMTMYDLTGVESQRGRGRTNTAAQINMVLSRPEAQKTVATIVHEATHQIAFNCGLHTRLSDCPRWFSEGVAMYFETLDLSSAKGRNGIGEVNQARLDHFLRSSAGRSEDWLESLLRDDRRFTDPKQALDAYAAAWALTYFLIRQHPKEYVEYLRQLSDKKPLLRDDPERRIDDFRKAFGELPKLQTEFQRYMSRAQ